MSLTAFVLAALALLLAPGPTNTLMGVVGAQRGLGHVLRLLPAELAGYLGAVLPLLLLGLQLPDRWPLVAAALKLAAALWVMALAVRLWRLDAGHGATAAIGPRRVFVTTLLNPKALVFGLVLLPAGGSPALRLMLLCLMIAAAALAWGGAGTLVRAGSGGSRRLLWVQRIASAWLACIALTLLAGAIAA
ncbi:hypothetical protein [Paracoccus sp. (in: a-proteobacteria)]|uniref:hypothetical protein n=1 Tax=Paracoccus sp. TaxID=267 RepID=UPI0032203A9C